jgi:nucleoside-diphosphate-sugar epimerase
MRALVTGGSGFVGSHLVEHLLGRGVAVRCLVRSAAGRWLPDGVEQIRGDVVSGRGLREACDGMDVVFHVAGVTKARAVSDFYEGNVRGTANLLEAGAGVPRFVYVSSLAAVGPGRMLDEDAPARPLSHYGRSKLRAEELLRGRAVIVRPPVVFGPRDTDVLQIFRTVARGRMVQIGREPQCFSYIYVKDLARALEAAACAPAPATYFVCDPKPVTWSLFGATAAEILKVRVKTLAVPLWMAYAVGLCGEFWSHIAAKPVILSRDKIAEARHAAWTCDPARARTELGFASFTPLREALTETLAWYQQTGWLR